MNKQFTSWCADSLNYDETYLEEGRTWPLDNDPSISNIKYPIGYIRRKPIVRVKAGSQSIQSERKNEQ